MTHPDMRLVPVSASLPLHSESVRVAASLRAEAKRRGRGVPSDLPGFHKDLWTAAEIIDMAEEFHAFTHQINEVLAAAPHQPQPAARDVVDDRLHSAIVKLKSWVELIQQGKRGKSIAGSPIVDCINDLPAIIRELDAAELEIEAAFEGYEDAAQAALRAQQPAQGEAVTEDIAWSDKPLDNELHEHFVSDYGLSNEEAAEAAGDVLSIIAKHAPSQQPADDKLAKAVEALEPLARLELPKKPVGNAGAYSILHTDIRRAKEALAALKTEVK